jgi:adenylate cyclase
VDVFEGPLDGLVIAEVELPRPDHPLDLPPWAGSEVTDDPRYANAALASTAAPPQG